MQPLIRLSAFPLRNLATTSRLQKRILQADVHSRQTLNANREAVVRSNTLTKAPMSTYTARGPRNTNQFAPHHRPQLSPRFSKVLGQTQSRRLLSLWDFYFPRDMTIWDTLVLLTPLFFAFFLGMAFHWYTSEPEGSEGGDEDDQDDVEEDTEE